MFLNSLVQGVLQNSENLHHWFHVEDVVSENITIGWKIEVSTIDDIPNGHVCAHSGGDELRQSAHTGIRVGVSETVDKMFCCILLNWLQIFYFVLVDKVPNYCIIEMKVSQNFSL